MIWSDHIGWYEQKVIYVVYANGIYQRFDDKFDPATDPQSGNATPLAGLLEPLYGFGKLWREQFGIKQALGWATAKETSGNGRFQLFDGGDMIWVSQTKKTYVFVFKDSRNQVQVFDMPFSEK